MKINEAFDTFCTAISSVYDTREANNIARIVFEDEFNVTNTERVDAFSSVQVQRLAEFQDRLQLGEPWQYILGAADFYGYKFKVAPGVLIPRPETEELVFLILQKIQQLDIQKAKVLDIGTGSACIPVTLKKQIPTLDVHALDVSKSALEIAKANADLHRVEINFLEKDILNEATWTELGDFDVIVSNPPYIPEKEAVLMTYQVKNFEPKEALFVPDETPLMFYEKIATFAKEHLTIGGWLFFEANEFNAPAVKALLEKLHFQEVELIKDLSGKDRMLQARN